MESESSSKLDLSCLSGVKNSSKASEALHCVADWLCQCPPDPRTTQRLPPEPAFTALKALVLAAAAPASEPEREALLADVLEAGLTNADVATALADAALARRADVRKTAAGERAASISKAHLVDFDWRAAITVASDTAVAMERPVVTVALIHVVSSGFEQNFSGLPKDGSWDAIFFHIFHPPPSFRLGKYSALEFWLPYVEFSTQPPGVMKTRSSSPRFTK